MENREIIEANRKSYPDRYYFFLIGLFLGAVISVFVIISQMSLFGWIQYVTNNYIVIALWDYGHYWSYDVGAYILTADASLLYATLMFSWAFSICYTFLWLIALGIVFLLIGEFTYSYRMKNLFSGYIVAFIISIILILIFRTMSLWLGI